MRSFAPSPLRSGRIRRLLPGAAVIAIGCALMGSVVALAEGGAEGGSKQRRAAERPPVEPLHVHTFVSTMVAAPTSTEPDVIDRAAPGAVVEPHVMEPVPSLDLLRPMLRSHRPAPYVEPVTADLDLAYMLAQQAMSRELGDSLAGAIGLEARSFAGGRIVSLHEPRRELGAGLFIFRAEPTRRVIIEVPHSFHDRKTLPIGQDLFDDLGASALLVNGSHRYHGARCNKRRRSTCPSDVAHSEHSIFHAVHRSLVDASPGALVVAVHGFRQKKGDPHAIISAAGTRADAGCVARHARAVAGLDVAAYPEETLRLGGVEGAQARYVAAAGGRMIHIELSPSYRGNQKARLTAALADAIRACEG